MVQPLISGPISTNSARRSAQPQSAPRHGDNICLPTSKFDATTGWGRNALAAVVAVVLLAMVAFGVQMAHRVTNTPSAATLAVAPLTIRVTVHPGESLWSLSQRYGNPGEGIQDRVDAMAKANGVGAGTSLIAGQRLLVPVSNPVELARLQTHLASVR